MTGLAGAEYMQSVFGTEKDRFNCPFYFKMGACRHGDKCDRRHNKPALSQTLILLHMYQNPVLAPGYVAEKAQDEFEEFYEDVFEELAKYGDIEELHVNDNICDHMVGNVYVKYFHEEDAERALKAITGRFYAGRPIVAEFSPVTDFKEASCRQYESNKCDRGGHCNFMHLKGIPKETYKRLYVRRKRRDRSTSRDRKSSKRRSRSRSKERDKRSSRRHKSRSRDRKDRRRSKSRERDGPAWGRASKEPQEKEEVYRERERERDRGSHGRMETEPNNAFRSDHQ